MLNLIAETLVRGVRARAWNNTDLYVVVPKKGMNDARNALVASFPKAPKTFPGHVETSAGKRVFIRSYADAPPTGEFDLFVCTGGEFPSDTDRKNLKKWRSA